MLSIRDTVCNEFPYAELGKPTLTSIVHKRQLSFYNKCIRDDDWPMQWYIIRKVIDYDTPFIKHLIELNRQFKNPNDIIDVSLKKMLSQIRQKANNNKSRYKTYLTMNSKITVSNTYIRNISHDLQIEKGRQGRTQTPIEQRVCKCGDIEDEKHFF